MTHTVRIGNGPDVVQPEHVHAYADPVRTGVESTRIVGGDPTWTLIEEIFTYVCACGDKIETRVPITRNPVLEMRYGRP